MSFRASYGPEWVIFTKPGCSDCDLARWWMLERGIEFREEKCDTHARMTDAMLSCPEITFPRAFHQWDLLGGLEGIEQRLKELGLWAK